MRIIKMFSWEMPFIRMVLRLRNEESKFIFKELAIYATFISVLIIMPILGALRDCWLGPSHRSAVPRAKRWIPGGCGPLVSRWCPLAPTGFGVDQTVGATLQSPSVRQSL